jgi:CHAD domain-containing protein
MYIYTLSLLSKEKAISFIEKSSLKALNVLQQAIGDWHDHDLLYQKVKKLSEKKNQYSLILPSIELSKKELEALTLSELTKINSYNMLTWIKNSIT